MYEFIEGKVEELNPAYVIINCNGIGYFINISLNTFSKLEKNKNYRLFVHFLVREDAHQFYGFFTIEEREIFRYLISVSGVGANTGRMMLSSMNPNELERAILSGNVAALKEIKGIGAKSAQRIIIELKDKLGKSKENDDFLMLQDNTIHQEALSALVALGFAKNNIEKVINKILSQNNTIDLESLIKEALKNL